jgi:cytochrome c
MKKQMIFAVLFAVSACSKAPETDGSDTASAPTETAAAAAGTAPAAFAQCSACHQVKPGASGLGPNLHGVVGRKAGTLAGYSYSSAMKASGKTWDAASIDAYIEAPQKVLPGTRMSYPGLKDKAKRDEVIAWLKSNS